MAIRLCAVYATFMSHEREHETPEAAPPAGAGSARRRALTISDNRIASTDLFVDTREVVIQHGNMSYRLRLTAQDKLILTK